MYIMEGRIRFSETDSTRHLTLQALLDYFQDCSTFHSEDLGVGIDYLDELDCAWVLNSWQIDVSRFPVLGEKVTIATVPYKFNRYLGFRNFELRDADGKRLAVANTIWTLLNLKEEKPALPTALMQERYGSGEPMEMEMLPRKILIPKEGGIPGERIRVEQHHLDTNQHVNNGQYVRMALACIGPDGFAGYDRLRAEYKQQAFLGDILQPIVYHTGEKSVISLNDAEGKPIAVVEVSKIQ